MKKKIIFFIISKKHYVPPQFSDEKQETIPIKSDIYLSHNPFVYINDIHVHFN